MKIEEFPQFLQVLDAQKASFDPLHLMYHKVFRSGYLHFGFWPTDKAKDVDLEALLDDLRVAQIRFADELLTWLPAGPCRVLDVGAGLGRLSADMAAKGHAVTAVTPCAHQTEQIAAKYPQVQVRCGRFQEVGEQLPSGAFDVIIFSESFRYMPLSQVFKLFERLLAPNGRVIIADWFAHDSAGTKHGHDHNHNVFRDAARANSFVIGAERDVTANVFPTVKLAYDVLCEFYAPLAGFVLAKFAQKRPRLFRFTLKWILRWMERRVLPQLPGRCDPQVFASHYRYFFFVLQRAPFPASS